MNNFAQKFRRASYSVRGILWLTTAGVGLLLLLPTGDTWLTIMSGTLFVLSLTWSIWASTAPK